MSAILPRFHWIRIPRWTALAALLLGVTAGVRAEETPPALVVSLHSVDRLLAGLNEIPHAREAFDRSPLAANLSLVRRDQPWGLSLYADERHPDTPVFLVTIPVADMQRLAGLVQSFNVVTLRAGEGDRWTLEVPTRRIECRYVDQMLHLGSRPEVLSRAEAHVETLRSLTSEFDLAARVRLDGVPQAWRDDLLKQVETRLAEAEAAGGGNHPLPAVRLQTLRFLSELTHRVATGTDRIDAGVKIDRGLLIRIDWIALSGSPLADDFAQLAIPDAAFSTLYTSAAASLRIAVQLPPWVRESVGVSLTALRSAAAEKISGRLSDEDAAAALRLLESAVSGVQSGRIVALAGFVPNSEQVMSFVAMTSISDARGALEALSAIVPKLAGHHGIESVDMQAISADDRELHRVTRRELPRPERMLYGEQAASYLGTLAGNLAFAIGPPACEELLAESRLSPVESSPLIDLRWSARPWLELGRRRHPENPDVIGMSELFPDQSDDDVTATVTPIDNGLRGEIQAQPGYLRALGLLAGRW